MVTNEFTTIGRYEIINLLGRGGMGTVYLGRDPVIDRHVAIKVLEGGFDTVAHDRFTREARAAGRLHHPNIVTIFDVGEHQGRPFIAMEHVPGHTLAMLIQQGQLVLAEKLRLMADACAGLAYAHRAGIIHLDIKPANLVRHENGLLKILDFGIARVLTTDATTTHQILGTLRYMAPERVSGERIDRRTDVFALGCVLYEVIAGQPAFKGTITEVLMRATAPMQVPALSELVPGLHPDLVRMTERAMAFDPDDRYDDLDVLKEELDTVWREIAPATQTTPPALPSRPGDYARRGEYEKTPREPRTPLVDRSSAAVPQRSLSTFGKAALVAGIVVTVAGAAWLFRDATSTPVVSTDAVDRAPAPPASTPAPEVPEPRDVPSGANRPAATRGGTSDALEPRAGQQARGATGQSPITPPIAPQPGERRTPDAEEQSAAAVKPSPSVANGGLPAAPPIAPAVPDDRAEPAEPPRAVPAPAQRADTSVPSAARPSAEDSIRGLLRAYEAAYDGRDADALRRIFPGQSAERHAALTKVFANSVSYNVDLEIVSINVTDSTAVATCLVGHSFVPKIGSASRNGPTRTRFYLRQTAGDWVIDRLE